MLAFTAFYFSLQIIDKESSRINNKNVKIERDHIIKKKTTATTSKFDRFRRLTLAFPIHM